MEIAGDDHREEVCVDPGRSRSRIDKDRSQNPGLLPGACQESGGTRQARQEIHGVEPLSDARQGGRDAIREGEPEDVSRQAEDGVRSRYLTTWLANCEKHPWLAAAAHAGLPEICEDILLCAFERILSDEQISLLAAYHSASPLRPVPVGHQDLIVGKVVSFCRSWRFPSTRQWRLACTGYLLQGTVPKSVEGEVQIGDVVSFDATITAAEGRPGFGWIKRPKGAHIVQKSGKENLRCSS